MLLIYETGTRITLARAVDIEEKRYCKGSLFGKVLDCANGKVLVRWDGGKEWADIRTSWVCMDNLMRESEWEAEKNVEALKRTHEALLRQLARCEGKLREITRVKGDGSVEGIRERLARTI
jgi:hypothetical protein